LFQTDIHTNTPITHLLQAGCSFWRPANSVKALKAELVDACVNIATSRVTNVKVTSYNVDLTALTSLGLYESVSLSLFACWTLCVSVNDKTAQQCPLIVWCLFRVRMWVGFVVPARRWVSLQHCSSTSSVACQTLTVTIDWLLNWSSWSTRSCDLSCASWLLTNSLSMNHSPLLLYDCSVYIQGGPLTASYYKLDHSYFIKIS